MRLLLIIIVGIIYVRTMLKMAVYDNCEITRKKHVVLKIFGGFSIFFSVVLAFVGIFLINHIEYPSETITYSPFALVRPSSNGIIWGYPTRFQNVIIACFSHVFIQLGIAAYCFYFKSSNTSIWKKILKFIGGTIFVILYFSATDFHYFDLNEWFIPILFFVIVYFISKGAKQKVSIANPLKQDLVDTNTSSEVDDTESDRRYLPKETSEHADKDLYKKTTDQNTSEKEEQIIEETKDQVIKKSQDFDVPAVNVSSTTMKFCRHCGKKIDYIRTTYCKYCGKILD